MNNLFPTLENWKPTIIISDYSKSTESSSTYLTGQVYNHPNFVDGQWIITSNVNSFNLEKKFFATQYRTYGLGTPNQKWKQQLIDEGHLLETYSLLK